MSPSRRAPARKKRATKAAKPASKKRAAKAVKPASRKRVAKAAKPARVARKKIATKRPAKRPSRGATLRLIRPRPRKKPAKPARLAPPPAFPQTAGSSPRQLLMFELVRARVAVHAAVQGLMGGAVDQPMSAGKWSAREHVLHLYHWDREALRLLESVMRGVAPPWQDWAGPDFDPFNERGVAEYRHLDWDETLRRLHAQRQELLESLESIPDDAPERWEKPHPLGALLHDLVWNDRHHAEAIKRWRTERGA